MNRALPVSAEDSDGDCPVPIDMLSRLYHAEPEALADQLGGIPETTRARLAVYLYLRSHTRQLGVSYSTPLLNCSKRLDMEFAICPQIA